MALGHTSTFRLVKDEERPSYVYREVTLPSPVGDELLVKVGKVALCGTDISLYQWNNGQSFINAESFLSISKCRQGGVEGPPLISHTLLWNFAAKSNRFYAV